MAGESEYAPDRGPKRDDDLTSLRALIVGPESRRLDGLEARLDDPEARADAVAEVLPKVLLEHAQDPRFARALTPPLEKAITTSVQRNPKPLSEALFPVMGPAIRKAVAVALAGMVESLNRTLDHAFSVRSLQWRLEAMRTGKSFGEVVLLKTLVYRVEQVFLIERNSGLLLQHVWAEAVPVKDADMVSSMLTAIRDFAHDSFTVSSTESLDSLKVGDLSVWIEPGPHAMVAAVIRGSAPSDFRRRLQEALETVHLQFGDALQAFQGDAAVFAESKGSLEGVLHTEFRANERRSRSRATWIVAGAALALLLVWGIFYVRAGWRWSAYVNTLRAEPGIFVASERRVWGGFTVTGLRDPLSRDPVTLLDAAGVSKDAVTFHWTPYYALDPALVERRAAATLRPPPGVALHVSNGVLSATGDLTVDWIDSAMRTAPFLAGVTAFDAAGAFDAIAQRTIDALQGPQPLFVRGSAKFLPGQDVEVARISEHVRTLSRVAVATSRAYRLDIVGYTDADGPDASNLPLSRARAAALQAAIAPAALPGLTIVTSGQGSREPVVVSDNEQDKQRNRRAKITVSRVPS